jgi:hypothetical protein
VILPQAAELDLDGAERHDAGLLVAAVGAGQFEPRGGRQLRDPVAAPARQVRDQHVGAEMKLRLEQDPPSTRAAAPALKRTADFDRHAARGQRVLG